MPYINVLDVVGSIFSLSSTICCIRVSTLAWPLGLVAICIDIVLYTQKGIYGDLGLHCIYLFMMIYGWWQWKFGGKNRTELPITSLDRKNSLFLLLLFTGGVIALSSFLKVFTDSQVPYWDAMGTCLSLIAQWLTCRKVIQNWWFWFVSDIIFASLYLYKGLPAHSITHFLYLALAVMGYLHWKKQAIPIAAIS